MSRPGLGIAGLGMGSGVQGNKAMSVRREASQRRMSEEMTKTHCRCQSLAFRNWVLRVGNVA